VSINSGGRSALTALPFYVTSQIEGPLRQAILIEEGCIFGLHEFDGRRASCWEERVQAFHQHLKRFLRRSKISASLVKNPAAETAGRLKIEYSFSVSFPQAKRVGNPSDTLSE